MNPDSASITRVVLASNDARIADQVSALVSESAVLALVATLGDPRELRGSLPRGEIDALVIHERQGAGPLGEVTRELATAYPETGIVVIAAEESPALMRVGMQAGARDVIAEPFGLEQLEASVLAAASWTHALRGRALPNADTGADAEDERDADDELVGLGRVVTVVGSKGGVGTTTIAVNMALAARQRSQASVSLLEYDLAIGDARAFLDVPYGRGVLDLALAAEEITGRQLREAMYLHLSGIRALLAPLAGAGAEQVSGDAARNILSAIRTRHDLTIVDAGAVMNDVASVAVEMADTVLVVTTPDIVSLRGVVRMLEVWERIKLDPPDARVLLNRTSRKRAVQPDLVRRVVGAPLLEATVPVAYQSLEPAVNAGISSIDAASEAVLQAMAAVLEQISAPRAEAQDLNGSRNGSLNLVSELVEC